MKKVTVNLKENPYTIYIKDNLIEEVTFYINDLNLGNFGVILTSQPIVHLYKHTIQKIFKKNSNYTIITVADGENSKSQKSLFKLIKGLLKIDTWNRKIFLICFGGGTIGDLGGFAASIYKRGIPYIQIPTTFLSQIDSSIGGKTAINLKEAKNILGTFYQPKVVFIDPKFLLTLPIKQIKEGIAETIKYGAIKDKHLFYFLKNNHKKIMEGESSHLMKIISTCVNIKAKIVEKDEKETKGIRTILNFGHTFAHALESSLRYKKISHGEAVSVGMMYAAYLSYLLGKCTKNTVKEIKEILEIFSLPTQIDFDDVTLYKAISYDKKFLSGRVRMVLLKEIGLVEVAEDIPLKNIRKSLKNFSCRTNFLRNEILL